MNQYVWYGLTQIITLGIAVGSVSLLERRRLRTSGNFERKQAHYADLFDVVYKVSNALQQWHTNVFVSNEANDIVAIERELNSKDVGRMDALNQIWSSPKVIETTERWIDHRKALARSLSTIREMGTALTVEERIQLKRQADASKEAMVNALTEVRNAVQEDLFLKKRGK